MQFLIEDIQSMQLGYMYYLIIIAHLLQSKECISEFKKKCLLIFFLKDYNSIYIIGGHDDVLDWNLT